MLEFKTGDILETDAEALVNTVNCVGIMGRGIALQFKNVFPENFKAYKAACDREEVQPGKMFVFETGTLTNPKYIINFPTKRHWRGKSRMEDIESGLEALAEEIRERHIRSVAIPPLGSGLGGLKWADVRMRIENALRPLNDVIVIIFEPNSAPIATKSSEVPNLTAGRAALIILMNRYLGGLLDPFVTLLEVHKLMYFMQASGEPLRLKFQKAPYGPYAENLRHVLSAVEGYFISGYEDGGDAPDKQLEIVPGAVKDAEALLKEMPETVARFDRVGSLVEGFETPFGLELLSTVHWVATQEDATNAEDIEAKVYDWNDRKSRFSPGQIGLAFETLRDKGWLTSNKQNAPTS
jgi:O-acetyl-ADP-ribose deacetylase (regulator of RNase III)